MANFKFTVRNMEASTAQTIYVSARFGRNEKLMYATPLKVEPIFWDAERQRVKISMYCRYSDDVNSALVAIYAHLGKITTDAARNGQGLDKQGYIDALDTYFGKKQAHSTFHDFFLVFIEECSTRISTRKGGQVVTRVTKQKYSRVLYYINEFEKKKGVTLDFNSFDKPMMLEFATFLQSLNLATNTISHKIATLKAVLHEAVERGMTDNMKWQSFKRTTEESEAVALNEEELEKIRLCKLRNEHVERIRDLFLMGCWTGLRFSDISNLRQEHIRGDMIVIQQQKTNNYVTIPIHPVFREIWEKYKGIPIKISNQKFNARIKEICQMAGITEYVLKSITRGGKKITTKYEKWQLVSSHTARRSFATNLYKSGFPSISIMQITGHKSEAAFLKYIKVTPQEHAKLLAEHWKHHTSI